MYELWDAYDKDFNLIEGKTLLRGEIIQAGVYHLVCDIAVRHTDGTYLLTQRDFNKNKGGRWELSAGGSALKGESPDECAVRELFEETGIKAQRIEKVGFIYATRQAHYAEYLCITDCDKNSIILQESETIAYKWVDQQEIIKSRDELASARILKFIPELH